MTSYKIKYSMVVEYVKEETSLIKRAENKLDSGHVQSMQFDGTLGIISGVVKASMKNESHQVEIHLKSDGIDHTSCTCARGAHPVCSHRVAILLHGLSNISPTDSACSWRAPSGSAVATTSVDTIFPSSRRDYDPTDEPLREEDRIWFREELGKLNRFTGFYWLLQDEPVTNPETFPWPCMQDILQRCSTKEAILDALALSNEDILSIAEKTKGQRDNPLWFQMKFGRLTASNFGSVISAMNKNSLKFPKSLFSKLLGGGMSLDNVKSIQYGITHEADAIIAFEKKKNLKVVSTGLWLEPSGLLGASPDGLVGDDAIIEVKCPYKHRNSTLEEVLADKSYCLIQDDEGEYDIDDNHPYYHQIQGQLHLANRSLCYFLVWAPKFSIIMVIPKDDEWGVNLIRLQQFHMDHLLPKLMD